MRGHPSAPLAVRHPPETRLLWQDSCRYRAMNEPQELRVFKTVNDTVPLVRVGRSRLTLPKLDQPGKWIAGFIALEVATILLLMTFIMGQLY